MNLMPSTPWGPADSVTEIAPGIARYSTASHGGIRLSTERVAAMPLALRMITPFAGIGWYEEDCDWALVALSFPYEFQPASVAAAVATASTNAAGSNFAPVRAWFQTPEAQHVHEITAGWREKHANDFHWVGMGSVPRALQALARQHEDAYLEQHGLPTFRRAHLSYVTLRRISDNAPAAALLFDHEMVDGVFDLGRVPAERIIERPAS